MPGKDLSALGWLLWKSLWWKTNSVFKKSLHKFFSNLKWKELYWVPWKWYIVLQSRLCTETVNKSIGTAFSGHIWAYLRMMSLDLKHFMLSHCSWGADQNPCHAPLYNLISALPLSPVLQPEIIEYFLFKASSSGHLSTSWCALGCVICHGPPLPRLTIPSLLGWPGKGVLQPNEAQLWPVFWKNL